MRTAPACLLPPALSAPCRGHGCRRPSSPAPCGGWGGRRRQVFLAHHAVGDIDALRAAAARLARINEQLGAASTWKHRPLNSCVTYSLAPSPGPGEGAELRDDAPQRRSVFHRRPSGIPMPPGRTSRQQRGHPFPQVIRHQLGRHPKDPAETTPNCRVPQRTSL
jgi:hypothetical protein